MSPRGRILRVYLQGPISVPLKEAGMEKGTTRRAFLGGVAVAGTALLSGCGSDNGTGPTDGTIQFTSGSNLVVCAAGTIHLFIDGTERGTMSAGQSRSFSGISTGSHTVSARDNTGTWGPATVNVSAGATTNYNLTC